ncbi:hypothetical protein [Bosea vaviloviae]|uniref:Uncharacterized protein n=1 Tax=Bosea vaviloviae TaxID=1526658 RepID=A0A1D7U2L5_9HYPH|nr:hypothetical protein [Bosea vaviloviae]AOO81619.1 hypothetical protein BHK69_15185 [Bosea vaviloviae]
MTAYEQIGTGRELALVMAARFPHEDWIADLANQAGKSRDFIEWHLQEDLEPPTEILAAAGALLNARDRHASDRHASDRHAGDHHDDEVGQTPAGIPLLSGDDLPFSGLPGNLGKLRKS